MKLNCSNCLLHFILSGSDMQFRQERLAGPGGRRWWCLLGCKRFWSSCDEEKNGTRELFSSSPPLLPRPSPNPEKNFIEDTYWHSQRARIFSPREIAFLAVLNLFPSSKIDFWSFLKLQKMEFV